MENQTTKFENWCIVELFGHQKIAGYCTEQNLAGANMLRVDVPETTKQPAFTKLYGGTAIYAINPVDEITAKLAVENLQVAPVALWAGKTFTEKYLALAAENGLPEPLESDDDDDDDTEFDDDDDDDTDFGL